MNNPRTIDNLGYDASQRYALDQKILMGVESMMKESKNVFNQAFVEVVSPSFSSEFETLFDAAKKNSSWAEFLPPVGYHEQKRKFFTYQLFPTLLGSQEKGTAALEKLLVEIEKRMEKYEQEQDAEKESKEQEEWEKVHEKEKKEKEKKTILQLLHCILDLDKCMIYLTSKRGQYQKG
jgi:hypothetical protein